MKLLNRQFLKETLGTTATVSLVIMSIFLVIRLVPFLRDAAEGEIPVASVLILLLLNLVTYLDLILPLMGFIGVLMVVNRWCVDNEMAIACASGFGLSNFLKPLSLLMLALGSVVGLLALFISPWSVRYALEIENEFKAQSEVTGIIPGQFLEPSNGEGIYFVEDFDESSENYFNVFAYSRADQKDGIVNAKKAFKIKDDRTGDTFLVLKDGIRYEGVAGDPEYRIIEYETYALRIDEGQPPAPPGIPIKGYTTKQLINSERPRLKIELMWRLSKPLIVPVLLLFALALGNVHAKQNRMPSLLAAFFIYFAYTNFVSYIMALMKKGSMQSSLLLWLVHSTFLLIGIYMFYRSACNKRFLPRLLSTSST